MISRCDSAAMVPNTSDDLPDPETPVNTVSRRLGISTLTSFRLFTRAPWTRIRSWLSALRRTLTSFAASAGRVCGVMEESMFAIMSSRIAWLAQPSCERSGVARLVRRPLRHCAAYGSTNKYSR